jgi:hypothetical protein
MSSTALAFVRASIGASARSSRAAPEVGLVDSRRLACGDPPERADAASESSTCESPASEGEPS